MRREKVFNRSLLILAIMSIMLFAMTNSIGSIRKSSNKSSADR